MISRREFEAIAAALRLSPDLDSAIVNVAAALRTLNPQFDTERFLAAVTRDDAHAFHRVLVGLDGINRCSCGVAWQNYVGRTHLDVALGRVPGQRDPGALS